jgi:hypothetical protein
MPKSKLPIAIACLLWAISIGLGLYLLMNHEITPGAPPQAPPIKFPKDTKLKLSSDKDTLVMFVHPQCPCTTASLKQLAPLSLNQNLNIQLVHFKPSITPDGWKEEWQLDDWTKQKTVQVIEDSDGHEAKRFDAKTSGQTFLFNPSGALLFHGGITAARGVTGDNVGFNTLLKALARDKTAEAHDPNLKKSLVFGCNLLNERN